MLKIDQKVQEDAIKLYKEIIALAVKENDVVTKRLFEKILSQEEEHHNKFQTLLDEQARGPLIVKSLKGR